MRQFSVGKKAVALSPEGRAFSRYPSLPVVVVEYSNYFPIEIKGPSKAPCAIAVQMVQTVSVQLS